VVGVVEDFHFTDFKSEIKPLLMFCYGKGRFVTMRLQGDNILETVKVIEGKWAEFSGGKPFDYNFVDQQFDNLFQTEQRLANLTILFSILTIVTASLGLFGLAAFVARSRRKEFGIRKILGAGEGLIWYLQLKYFASIAIISLIIAMPLAYYLTDIWLDEFVYRISNGVSIYGMAIVSITVIILISVGYQSLKASRLSPVNVLREE
jgi:putative ABC transport system permease protein